MIDASPEPTPFLELDRPGLSACIADATYMLLRDRGVDRLSSRAIAGWLRQSPSSLTAQADRSEQIRHLVIGYTRRWLVWSTSRSDRDRPVRLPTTAHERHGVRVWLAMLELARGEQLAGNELPVQLIAGAVEREREELEHTAALGLHRRATEDEVDHLLALTSGLRLLVDLPGSEVTPERAAALLRAHLDTLGWRVDEED